MAEDDLVLVEAGAAKVLQEQADYLSQKMSNKVRVQRWNGPLSPVIGPNIIIGDLDKIADALVGSGFMHNWFLEKVKEHLLSGGVFTNRGEHRSDYEDSIVPNGQVVAMQVRSEYRMASEKEVLDYVDTQQFANVTGHAISKRAQETRYALHYHEGAKLIEAYDGLPRQAKVILDMLDEAGRESYTEASIEMILSEGADRLKTKQEPGKIFGFYRRRLIDEGHLEEL